MNSPNSTKEKAGLGLGGVGMMGPTMPPRGCQGRCKRLRLLSSGRMKALSLERVSAL